MRLILNDLNVRTCSTHLLAATLCELWHVAMYTEPHLRIFRATELLRDKPATLGAAAGCDAHE